MTTPFIGQVQLFGFNFAPRGWAASNGASLPISQNTALFSLIGFDYGGNGQTTFQLPNFTARAAAGQGSGPGLTPRVAGQSFGQAGVALNVNQIPAHRHVLTARTSPGTVANPVGALPASSEEQLLFDTGVNAAMTPLATTGSGSPHENRQPYLGVNICIALNGIFPSRQ